MGQGGLQHVAVSGFCNIIVTNTVVSICWLKSQQLNCNAWNGQCDNFLIRHLFRTGARNGDGSVSVPQTGKWGILVFRRASVFIAPQTRRWKMAGFRRASVFIAPQTRRWKWLAADAPLFYRATNTQVENGCFQTRLLFYRATITQVENGSVRLESKADTFTPRLYRRTMRVPLALNPQTCLAMQQMCGHFRSVCCGAVQWWPDTKVQICYLCGGNMHFYGQWHHVGFISRLNPQRLRYFSMFGCSRSQSTAVQCNNGYLTF